MKSMFVLRALLLTLATLAAASVSAQVDGGSRGGSNLQETIPGLLSHRIVQIFSNRSAMILESTTEGKLVYSKCPVPADLFDMRPDQVQARLREIRSSCKDDTPAVQLESPYQYASVHSIIREKARDAASSARYQSTDTMVGHFFTLGVLYAVDSHVTYKPAQQSVDSVINTAFVESESRLKGMPSDLRTLITNSPHADEVLWDVISTSRERTAYGRRLSPQKPFIAVDLTKHGYTANTKPSLRVLTQFSMVSSNGERMDFREDQVLAADFRLEAPQPDSRQDTVLSVTLKDSGRTARIRLPGLLKNYFEFVPEYQTGATAQPFGLRAKFSPPLDHGEDLRYREACPYKTTVRLIKTGNRDEGAPREVELPGEREVYGSRWHRMEHASFELLDRQGKIVAVLTGSTYADLGFRPRSVSACMPAPMRESPTF